MAFPDLAIEVSGNEIASATLVTTSTLELEVHLDNAVATGAVPATETVEVTLPGPLLVPDPSAVKNAGNVPALILLGPSDPIPAGTPSGTVVLRSS